MVSKPFRNVHEGNTSSLQFSDIERVSRPPRGEDHCRKLFARESFWIYSLGTRVPRGSTETDYSLYILFLIVLCICFYTFICRLCGNSAVSSLVVVPHVMHGVWYLYLPHTMIKEYFQNASVRYQSIGVVLPVRF